MGRTRQTEPRLTDRQREVLRLIAKGHTNSEIAEQLGITLAGAKWHVSDLLARFGVETRDELADAWVRETRPAARLARFAGAAFGGLALKPSAVAVALGGVAAMAIGLTAVAVSLSSSGDEEEPQVVAVVAGTATPVPTATLPAAPGAIWTADEALRRAELFAHQTLGTDINWTVTYGPLGLRSAQWLPGTTIFEAGDGDQYWAPPEGKSASDLWVFEFDTAGRVVDGSGEVIDPAPVWVRILLEDGIPAEEPTAEQHRYLRPDGSLLGGGSGSFRSRQSEQWQAKRQLEATAAGTAIEFGWHNGVVGGLRLEAYPSAAGYWCIHGKNADGTSAAGTVCKPEADLDRLAVNYSHGGRAPQTGGLEDAFLFAKTAPEIVTLGILMQGAETRYPTYAPPPESGIPRRFAWLGLGNVPLEGFEVIGYDAAGTEVWRQARDPMSPPPPPPPTRVR